MKSEETPPRARQYVENLVSASRYTFKETYAKFSIELPRRYVFNTYSKTLWPPFASTLEMQAEAIPMENVVFGSEFVVHSSDPKICRQWLTPDIQDLMLQFDKGHLFLIIGKRPFSRSTFFHLGLLNQLADQGRIFERMLDLATAFCDRLLSANDGDMQSHEILSRR